MRTMTFDVEMDPVSKYFLIGLWGMGMERIRLSVTLPQVVMMPNHTRFIPRMVRWIYGRE